MIKLPVKYVNDSQEFVDYTIIDNENKVVCIVPFKEDAESRKQARLKSEYIIEALNKPCECSGVVIDSEPKKRRGNPAFQRGRSNPYKLKA